MNEQDISKLVESVLNEIQVKEEVTTKHEGGHICSCSKNKMTLKVATELIAKVENKAQSMNISVVVAVVDAAARPVAVHCMDNSYIASYDIALNKAFTSVGLKMSTRELGELSQPGGPLYGISQTNGGKIVIFGGGEVLEADGKILGGIGVSGGTAKEDTDLAAYGKSVVREVLTCQ